MQKKNRRQLFISSAEDTVHGSKIRDSNLLKLVQQYYTCANSSYPQQKKGKTARILHYSIGTKILLNENLATEYGLVNGATGTIVDVIFPEENHLHSLYNGKVLYLDVPPLCILFRPDKICDALLNFPFPGLEPGVVPLFPIKETFKLPHPCGQLFTITRTQYPFTGAYAFTDYKAQGKTFHKLFIDPQGIRAATSPYVMLSRATGLNSIILLRPFTLDQLNTPWPNLFKPTLALLGVAVP